MAVQKYFDKLPLLQKKLDSTLKYLFVFLASVSNFSFLLPKSTLNVALYNFLEINIVVIAKPVLQNFTGL
jgi:hypothetical protein